MADSFKKLLWYIGRNISRNDGWPEVIIVSLAPIMLLLGSCEYGCRRGIAYLQTISIHQRQETETDMLWRTILDHRNEEARLAEERGGYEFSWERYDHAKRNYEHAQTLYEQLRSTCPTSDSSPSQKCRTLYDHAIDQAITLQDIAEKARKRH